MAGIDDMTILFNSCFDKKCDFILYPLLGSGSDNYAWGLWTPPLLLLEVGA